MTNVIDLSTRRPVPTGALGYSAQELVALVRSQPGPDFEKRRGKMVLTEEVRASTQHVYDAFRLQIQPDADPEVQILTWCWLAAKVATALRYHGTDDFEWRARTLYPAAFTAYVDALARGDDFGAVEAAQELGVLSGMPLDHPLAKALEL